MKKTFNFAVNFFPLMSTSIIVCYSENGIDTRYANTVAIETLKEATAQRSSTPRDIVLAIESGLKEKCSCNTVVVYADCAANIQGYPMTGVDQDHT